MNMYQSAYRTINKVLLGLVNGMKNMQLPVTNNEINMKSFLPKRSKKKPIRRKKIKSGAV